MQAQLAEADVILVGIAHGALAEAATDSPQLVRRLVDSSTRRLVECRGLTRCGLELESAPHRAGGSERDLGRQGNLRRFSDYREPRQRGDSDNPSVMPN